MADNNDKEYINSKGERVPRITQIIRMLNKEHLAQWANMLGFKRISYKGELTRTSNIGSMVHDVLEDFANENTITIVEDYGNYNVHTFGDKMEVDNAVKSFYKWYMDNPKMYRVVRTEYTIVGEEAGGTIDVILKSPYNKDKVIIGDYKTSKGFYLTMFLQLAGYVKLYEEKFGKNTVDGVLVFKLDKKEGKPAEAVFIRRKNMKKYIEAFESLMQTERIIRGLESRYKKDLEKFSVWAEDNADE